MKTKTPMRILTAQLGLKPSKRTSKTTPVLATLLDGLTEIYLQYPDHKSIRVIRESEGIKTKAEELFDRIGSTVWPDLDKNTKFPTWLLNPYYKVSKLAEHYPRHLQYSNHADRAILAELFYPFVCGRLQNSVKIAENRSKSGNRPGSTYHPSSEEPSTPEENDVFAGDNTTEDRDNNPTDPSSPRAASSERQSNVLLSAGRREMPPNIAPVAPMVSGQSSMNNHQTEPGAASSGHTHSRPRQNTKQLKRSEKDRPDQLRSGSARSHACSPKTGMAGLPFHTSPGPLPISEQSRSYPPQPPKRPLIDSTPVSSTKRSKISANVRVPKPSLIVTLKLTPAKDAPTQDNTALPQQPHIRMSSPELPPLDDIISRRSTAPVDRLSGVDNAESRKRLSDHQSNPEQESPRQSVEEAATDNAPISSGAEPTQTVPAEQAVKQLRSEVVKVRDQVLLNAASRSTGEVVELVANGSNAQRGLNGPDQTPHASNIPGPSFSITGSLGDTYQSSDSELERLVGHINMSVRVTREDGSVLVPGNTIGIGAIRNSSGFFDALQDEYGDLLGTEEDIFRVTVTQVDGVAEGQRKLVLKLLKASRIDRSWKTMLEGFRDAYEKDGTHIVSKLEAIVLVKMKSDLEG